MRSYPIPFLTIILIGILATGASIYSAFLAAPAASIGPAQPPASLAFIPMIFFAMIIVSFGFWIFALIHLLMNKAIQGTERGDGPNHHAFGTFVTHPADAGSAPKASGDPSSRTFDNYMKIEAIHDFHSKDYVTQWADRFQVTPVRQKLFDHMSDILQGSIVEKATVLELGIGPSKGSGINY
jgi:hypothetical protein